MNSQTFDFTEVRDIFVKNVVETIGNNSTITLADIEDYFDKYGIKWTESSMLDDCIDKNASINATCLLRKVSLVTVYIHVHSFL